MMKKSATSETPLRERMTTSLAFESRQICAARCASAADGTVVLDAILFGMCSGEASSDSGTGSKFPANMASGLPGREEVDHQFAKVQVARQKIRRGAWGVGSCQQPCIHRGVASHARDPSVLVHWGWGSAHAPRPTPHARYCFMTHTRTSGFTSACRRTGTR